MNLCFQKLKSQFRCWFFIIYFYLAYSAAPKQLKQTKRNLVKCITAQCTVFFKCQDYHHFCEGGINLKSNRVLWVRFCDLLAQRSTYQLVGDCSCYSVTPHHPLDSRDTDLPVLNPLFFGNTDVESGFITRSVTVLSRVKLTLIPLAHWLTILASWIAC